MESHKSQNIAQGSNTLLHFPDTKPNAVWGAAEVYRIENLMFTYPNREKTALSNVNLTIRRGEFLTICGPSGSGKTTLLRHLKPSTRPHGTLSGEILFNCIPLGELPPRDASAKIGFVMQSPENQIVTDKVWHELAFGLESLGKKTPEIRLRVAEMASFFGIQTWFHKPVTELSGGQKQLLVLASIMALQPSALILDEPTSQLDPIAAGEFLSTIGKINRELGVTIILTEHRLEEALPLSTRAIVMDNGTIIADGAPREVGLQLRNQAHGMFLAMPTPMRVWNAMEFGIRNSESAGNSEFGIRNSELENDVCPVANSECGMRNAESVGNSECGIRNSELEDDGHSVVNSEFGMRNSKLENDVCPVANSEYGMWNSELEDDTVPICPITVRDGANWMSGYVKHVSQFGYNKLSANPVFNSEFRIPNSEFFADSEFRIPNSEFPRCSVEMSDVWFKYDKNLPDVVKGLSFEGHYGEITVVLGGNGTGKTTMLSLIAGLYTPYRGKINTCDQVYMLPQNPQSLFVSKTVREDLLEILSERKLSKDEKNHRLAAMVKLCRLEELLDFHPYDLSGGEQQRAALAKVLLLSPKILLLDEPTKGLDAEFKQIFAAILKKLTAAGAAVIMASHDVEFCAEHADRCALFFDGDIVTANTPLEFFSGNSFYTTSANRMARDLLPEAVTADDIIIALGGKVLPPPEVLDLDAKYEIAPAELPPPPKVAKLSLRRRIIACVFATLLLATFIYAGINLDGFRAFISGGSEAVNVASEGALLYICIMLTLAVGIIGLTLSLTYKRFDKSQTPRIATARGKLSKRTIIAAALSLVAIPVTIYVGSYFFGDRKYYFISLLIILETMLPFALVFEQRKPQARELVVIAALCAIAVAGRAAFFMLPQFKPVVALVIIAGVALGGETGFVVGAMTGFVSNFFFGQGPWTPYQMFAFGIIVLLAGVLSRKGLLQHTPASLAIFGAFATFVVYGGIMNPSFVMIYQGAPTGAMLLTAYLQGIPMDLVHAAATAMFMLIISKPMLEKLDRIKVKYGLVE